MLESKIEQKLVALLRRRGAMAIKQEGTVAGVPDRLVVLDGGRCVWVELKQEHGHLRPVQEVMIARLRALGQDVRVLYGLQDVLDFVEEVAPREVQSQ